MTRLKRYVVTCALFAFVLACPATALAQGSEQPASQAQTAARGSDANLDVQFYLLAASNNTGEGRRLPSSLDGVARQLRATLPFENYRMAATFLHRVRDGGRLEVRGVGVPPLSMPANISGNSTFYQYRIGQIASVSQTNVPSPVVNLREFSFGLKVPIVTARVRDDSGRTGDGGFPVVQYEDTGITTTLNVREGEPTVVSTITTSRPEELLVLVVTVRRISLR